MTSFYLTGCILAKNTDIKKQFSLFKVGIHQLLGHTSWDRHLTVRDHDWCMADTTLCGVCDISECCFSLCRSLASTYVMFCILNFCDMATGVCKLSLTNLNRYASIYNLHRCIDYCCHGLLLPSELWCHLKSKAHSIKQRKPVKKLYFVKWCEIAATSFKQT